MGMSTSITGFRSFSGEFGKRFQATMLAMTRVGTLVGLGCVTPFQEPDASGYEVDLAKLPAGVTRIRFANSW